MNENNGFNPSEAVKGVALGVVGLKSPIHIDGLAEKLAQETPRIGEDPVDHFSIGNIDEKSVINMPNEDPTPVPVPSIEEPSIENSYPIEASESIPSKHQEIDYVEEYLKANPALGSREMAEMYWNTSVESYLGNHPYLSREAAEEIMYSYNSYNDSFNYGANDDYLELFTFDGVGKIVTGVDSFTALQGLRSTYTETYDDLYSLIADENWQSKADEMMNDANDIIRLFDEYKEMFTQVDGETGEMLAASLNVSMADLESLKRYISDNASAAVNHITRLQSILEYRDELNSELEEKNVERDELVSSEPPKTKACIHYSADTGGYEHPGGDPNEPEHGNWERAVTKLEIRIVELKKAIKLAEFNARESLANIQVFNDVRIKFVEVSNWDLFVERRGN